MKLYYTKINRKLLYLFILIFPFLLMLVVNEYVRNTIKEKPYVAFNTTTINSVNKIKDKCTWICHNETNYCKKNHVKFLNKYYKFSDVLYFGIIGLLASFGNYGLANILFLVILMPLLFWFLIKKSIEIQYEIHKLTNNELS